MDTTKLRGDMMVDTAPRGLIELRKVECDPNPNLIQIRYIIVTDGTGTPIILNPTGG